LQALEEGADAHGRRGGFFLPFVRSLLHFSFFSSCCFRSSLPRALPLSSASTPCARRVCALPLFLPSSSFLITRRKLKNNRCVASLSAASVLHRHRVYRVSVRLRPVLLLLLVALCHFLALPCLALSALAVRRAVW